LFLSQSEGWIDKMRDWSKSERRINSCGTKRQMRDGSTLNGSILDGSILDRSTLDGSTLDRSTNADRSTVVMVVNGINGGQWTSMGGSTAVG
jgi:hypothetical protein